MLENMIRVSPSQIGVANDLESKTLKEFGKDKKDEFKTVLEKRVKDKDTVSDNKLSGGTKKKITKADKKFAGDETEETAKANVNPMMVSNIMVSQEGVVETANLEEDLSAVQTDLQTDAVSSQNGQNEVQLDNQQLQAQKQSAGDEQSYQYLTDTEMAMLSEVNDEGGAPEGGIPTDGTTVAQTDLIAEQLNTDSKDAMSLANMTDVAMPEEATSSAYESKILDILKRENQSVLTDAQSVGQSAITQGQQDLETQLGSQSQGQDGQSGSTDSQQLPKSEMNTTDLAAQVAAIQSGQKSFSQHLNSMQAGAAVSNGTQLTQEANPDSNIREIMNQARFLVTQGGGEMNVKMTPEGMGEVHLKVMLENGKVNIEMNSQDKSVKKLIEDSLSDLKSSLALHQMRVEHVKINDVTAVDTQNKSNFQSDLNQSFSDQSGNRQPHMDFSQMNNSNSGRQFRERLVGENVTTDVKTQPTVRSMALASYTANNKGASINMVA